ncbi:MAG: hypothetical protein IT462_05890 [Planctomycetes bacterium]|nr:hypothetical protein [Planctomycetota bacterium]
MADPTDAKPEIKVTARVLDARPEGVAPPAKAADKPEPSAGSGEAAAEPELPEGPIRWPNYLILAMLAWLSLFLHVGAAVCSFFFILPGSLAAGAERVKYLAGAGIGWDISWGLWMLCSLTVVSFMAVLSRTPPVRNSVTYLASLLAGAGCAVDLVCDVIYIVVLPGLTGGDGGDRPGREGRERPGREGAGRAASALFMAFEKLAISGGMVVATGLYGLAVWLMTRQLAKNGVASPATSVIGFLTLAGSGVLVYGGFAMNADVMKYAFVPVVLLFISWTLSVARDVATKQGVIPQE